MNLKHLILITILAVAPIAATAQTTQRITAGKANEYGLSYNLPVSTFEIVLQAEETVQIPGEFYQYAKKLLGINPIIENSTSWKLVGAQIIQDAVPNEEERYLVQFKNGTNVFMTLTPEGFPVAVNDGSYAPVEKVETTLFPVEAEPTILDLPVARQAVTEEMLKSQSSAKRAELAAAKIYEIRQQRSDIISGQADNMPSDGEAMKLALAQLDQQEAALTAMFAGVTQTRRTVAVYSFRPECRPDKDQERVVIARLSSLDGFVDADDLSGDPIYLTMKVITRAELPKNEKGQVKTFPKGGFAYCIPGEANLSITYKDKTFAKEKMMVPQLGVVFGLDPSLFTDKKAPSFLRLDSMTGAVVEIAPVSSLAPAPAAEEPVVESEE